MENIDPNLIIKDFQSQIDVIIAELNQAKQESQTIAGFVSRGDSKTYANVAFIKSRAVLAYCVSANKRLQLAYENAKKVQDSLKQIET
jgi:hypothetical protein